MIDLWFFDFKNILVFTAVAVAVFLIMFMLEMVVITKLAPLGRW
jgi:hypothetical protein